jgi:hypothetical protein
MEEESNFSVILKEWFVAGVSNAVTRYHLSSYFITMIIILTSLSLF